MILLVDDEPQLRYALARILRRHGYDVMEAANANEAIALLEKSPFDLVLTDLQMPGQSGLVLTARIRVKWPETPIIIMSGHLSEAAGKIVAQGWVEFIHKPIESSTLISTIRHLLELGGSKTKIRLRRKIGLQTWHACITCNDWPNSDYEEMQIYLSDKLELCNECRLSLSQGKCL
jgi:DNA-binding NtrC family response regulator